MSAAAAKRIARHDPSLLSEAEFSRLVAELARLGGWRSYHVFDSRRSAHGYPDWTLAKPGRLIFAELKTETGKVLLKQQAWLDLLATVPGVEAYLWRPSQLDEIAETLTGRKVRP